MAAALGIFGRVLQADERFAVNDSGADACELEDRGQDDVVAQKRKLPKMIDRKVSDGARSAGEE